MVAKTLSKAAKVVGVKTKDKKTGDALDRDDIIAAILKKQAA